MLHKGKRGVSCVWRRSVIYQRWVETVSYGESVLAPQTCVHFLLPEPGGGNTDNTHIFPASYILPMSRIFHKDLNSRS